MGKWEQVLGSPLCRRQRAAAVQPDAGRSKSHSLIDGSCDPRRRGTTGLPGPFARIDFGTCADATAYITELLTGHRLVLHPVFDSTTNPSSTAAGSPFFFSNPGEPQVEWGDMSATAVNIHSPQFARCTPEAAAAWLIIMGGRVHLDNRNRAAHAHATISNPGSAEDAVAAAHATLAAIERDNELALYIFNHMPWLATPSGTAWRRGAGADAYAASGTAVTIFGLTASL